MCEKFLVPAGMSSDTAWDGLDSGIMSAENGTVKLPVRATEVDAARPRCLLRRCAGRVARTVGWGVPGLLPLETLR